MAAQTREVPKNRYLTLWDLVFYGIVLIQPIAPLPLFGVAQKLSNGHFVTIIMIAMFAMMITAVSYGRMAALYPAAGSAYTYVGKGLNPHLGFLAGWAMFMDYLLQPLINTVWISQALSVQYLAQVPYVVWAGLIAAIFTILNLRGIRSSALANKILLFLMFVVVGIFIVLAVRYLYAAHGWAGLASTRPFYDPATFDWHRIWGATSFAALTYIGFDGVTTLAEDAQNPKRNILLATVLVCAFTGVFGGLEAYLGQLVFPNWHAYHDLTTAFMDVSRRVGGNAFAQIGMGSILILAAFGSGLTGGLGAAKLLFGMGRDNVLPRKVFGHLSPGSTTPTYNLLIIGALTFAGAVLLNKFGNAYQLSGEMLNFGAFIAFMGVNLATFWQFTFIRRPDFQTLSHALGWLVTDVLFPLTGFGFCLLIWLNLSPPAKIVGGIWFAIGLTYLVVKTRGFRSVPATIDFSAA